ncbi:MAG: ABC transporter permease, partial [Acidobacteriota bacterium]|nr:ABC transporter permease [Acidobacteriota bacterium]
MPTFISRLLDFVLRRQREDRLSAEVQAHLDLLADDYVAQGMSPADARLAARKAFGGVDETKMRYREQRGLPIVDALAQDVRFAIRVLARDRGFALTAILVLGVGLGVNNMFFTLVYAHKFRGVAVKGVARVMHISTFDDRGANRLVSLPEFDDLQAATTSFSGLAAYVNGVATVGDEGRAPDRFNAAYVTANAFPLLGLSPSLGRLPLPDDDRSGGDPIVVLGRDAWRQRYGSDPRILGRSVLINGAPATVIGVVPERSGFPSAASVWLPLGQFPELKPDRSARTLNVVGRLRDGVSEDAAR